MSLKNFLQILICLMIGMFFTACAKKTEEAAADAAVVADAAPNAAENSDISSNEKLGTKWGDDVSSHVTKVDLHRVSGAVSQLLKRLYVMQVKISKVRL